MLSKTPKFRPTPNNIKSSTVAIDCDVRGHCLIKTFNVLCARTLSSELKLTPSSLESSHGNPNSFHTQWTTTQDHNQDYFDASKPSGYVWRKTHAMCSGLERSIVSFKQDTMQTTSSIAKQRLRIKPNLLSSERIIIRTVLHKNVGFNDSDKHFSPVLYSRDLYLEQCHKHLFDGKGTYEYTERPNHPRI